MRWKKRGMWHGFLTWHAEMSPLQEEWRNCGQRGLCRSKGWPGICTYQVSSVTSHSLQTHMFVLWRHHPTITSLITLYSAAWDCVLVCPRTHVMHSKPLIHWLIDIYWMLHPIPDFWVRPWLQTQKRHSKESLIIWWKEQEKRRKVKIGQSPACSHHTEIDDHIYSESACIDLNA